MPDAVAPGGLAAVDALAEEFQDRGSQPGLAYGIVAGGELAHARGLGERWVGGPVPDQRTVFRIASMTKSFTAAAVLLLRDEGALALDDLARDHLPELAGLRPPPGSPPVTIRRLLTMTAGFPTDDPWGDRQQGLALAEFARRLAGGASFAWTPGTRFEYSNLGYAILGRVIAAAAGEEYADFVARRLLRPLRMTATGFDAAAFAPDQLARGHEGSEGAWREVADDPYGAFAPMGGVYSCVEDLARWVGGFLAAVRQGEDGPHPLRPPSRLEMQAGQSALPPGPFTRLPGGPAAGGAGSYGFGLLIEHDPAHGVIVQHSGGYPGYGSHMRWHPGSGIGVIALANRTYSGPSALAARMLDALLRAGGSPAAGRPMGTADAPCPAAACPGGAWPGGAWSATLAAREAAMRLLESWDDEAAAALFAENVALDAPFAERRASIAVLRDRIGDFGVDESRPAEFDSPAHCRWWLRGERGTAAAEILLTPEPAPRVQALALAVPPAPGSSLAAALAALLSVVNGGGPGPLAALPAVSSLDTELLARRLRMAGAWAGRCVPGAFRAGNGRTATTAEFDGEHARVAVTLVSDASGVLHQADVLVGP